MCKSTSERYKEATTSITSKHKPCSVAYCGETRALSATSYSVVAYVVHVHVRTFEMTSDKAVLLKHYRDLARSIGSFSNGQACLKDLADGEDLDLETVCVTVSPNDGPYRGGKFDFEFDLSDGYPTSPPAVHCQTQIYHPNIDWCDDQGEVCLNLLDELWTQDMTLEDVVQGILFLLYNPNIEDPLSSMFTGAECEEEFLDNVRMSLRGEEVDGVEFNRNLPDGYESDSTADEDTGTSHPDEGSDALSQTESGATETGKVSETGSDVLTPNSRYTQTDSPTSQTVTADSLTSQTVTANSPTSQTVTADSPTSQTVTANSPTSQTVTANSPTSQTVTANSPTSQTVTANSPTSQTVIVKSSTIPASATTPSLPKVVESSVDREDYLLTKNNSSFTSHIFTRFWTTMNFWPAVTGHVYFNVGKIITRVNDAVYSRTKVYTDVDVHR